MSGDPQDVTMNTDALFENHSVKEIQEIEKKLRNDIERKKEELRQMVGERYRDLMEAADTITEMKDIAESVTNRIKSIEERCLHLQQGTLQTGILGTVQHKVLERKKKNELLYTVAALMKILMDAPTKIWSYLENRDFHSAVSLFLLSKHTYSNLVLDPVYLQQNLFHCFPIVNRQWASIGHLRHVLVQNSQQVLEAHDIKPDEAIGPLCCICLLADASLENLLEELLDIRKNVIQSIFHPEKYVKTQLCEFITIVQTTLNVIYAAFYAPPIESDSSNLLLRSLQKLTSKTESGSVQLLDIQSSETYKYLPKAILDFHPTLKVPIEACGANFVQIKCEQFLESVKSGFEESLMSLLSFVNSVKNLANIRQAITETLAKMSNWGTICESLLKKPFCIWNFFLRDCFLQRVEDIIEMHIKSAIEDCQRDIEDSLQQISSEFNSTSFEFERNISLYVWAESSNDVINNIAWIPHHQRSLWENGELSMKTLGLTPRIQKICKNLDMKLDETVKDISHFSFIDEEPSEALIIHRPFELFARHEAVPSEDSLTIFRYLISAMEKHAFDLTTYFETMLVYLENERHSLENNCRIVFLGHLCNGIAKLCPYLAVCLSEERLKESIGIFGSKSMHTSIVKECELWKDLKNKLQENNCLAFRLWSKNEIENILNNFNTELMTDSPEGLLKALLQWDKIEIQEESEQGNAVKSILRIPQHVSVPLSNALFALCSDINSMGGHTISSKVRSHISKQLLTGLLDVYHRKVGACFSSEEFGARMVQVQSLQLLFDVQFVIGLMMHKDDSCEPLNNISQSIINTIVSRIDPFDMDVFSTPLHQNIKRALQKSLSLCGLIACPEQVSYLNSLKSQVVNSQMEHNVMLSCSTTSRFPLLPLTHRQSTMATSVPDANQLFEAANESEAKSLHSHGSSPNLTTTDIQINIVKSPASFYDRVTAMSSSWFGN